MEKRKPGSERRHSLLPVVSERKVFAQSVGDVEMRGQEGGHVVLVHLCTSDTRVETRAGARRGSTAGTRH